MSTDLINTELYLQSKMPMPQKIYTRFINKEWEYAVVDSDTTYHYVLTDKYEDETKENTCWYDDEYGVYDNHIKYHKYILKTKEYIFPEAVSICDYPWNDPRNDPKINWHECDNNVDLLIIHYSVKYGKNFDAECYAICDDIKATKAIRTSPEAWEYITNLDETVILGDIPQNIRWEAVMWCETSDEIDFCLKVNKIYSPDLSEYRWVAVSKHGGYEDCPLTLRFAFAATEAALHSALINFEKEYEAYIISRYGKSLLKCDEGAIADFFSDAQPEAEKRIIDGKMEYKIEDFWVSVLCMRTYDNFTNPVITGYAGQEIIPDNEYCYKYTSKVICGVQIIKNDKNILKWDYHKEVK